MASTLRKRFWIEAGIGSFSGFLAVLTVFWRDWIEALTGFSPDHQDGSLEWMIVGALVLLCLGTSAAAWGEVRRPARALTA
jgi:hypothetical protein